MLEHGPDDLRPVLDGLAFPEAPRWHDGALWLSDIDDGLVLRVDPGACKATVAAEVAQHPSGLGWLPDGRMLVVSMHDRRLLRQEVDGSFVEAADLSGVAPFHCNDMVVDAAGRAYVGHFGFDPAAEKPNPASLVRVDPDGSVSQAADGLEFPNGAVISPDGATLIVAESWSHRLTAFDVDADGGLSGKRTWAQLVGAAPDGICLDEEGAIWLASPISKEVLRVHEGGAVVARISLGTRRAVACMLGDEDRRTLFVCSVGRGEETKVGRTGRIDAIEVGVAGSGFP